MSEKDENKLIAQRREKLDAIRSGRQAFPNEFVRQHITEDLHSLCGDKSQTDLEKLALETTVAGRIVTGVVTMESEQVLLVQTDKEQIRLPVSEVDVIRKSNQSLMPENLLKDLTDVQIRNLIGYLASPVQVPISGTDDTTDVRK